MNRLPRPARPDRLGLRGATRGRQTTVRIRGSAARCRKQQATGAFMQITSAQGGKLVSASSPVAGVVESTRWRWTAT